MRYAFPHAGHIDDYLTSIAGHDEFAVRRDPTSGIIVLNYIFQTENSFPDPNSFEDPAEARLAALRRECRGITFDDESGDVVSRKYHKFFNVGQRPETMANLIDWTEPHWIMEKLDGSMLTPFTRRDGTREWHTKMGNTQVAQPVSAYVARSALPYDAFNDDVRRFDSTPIYEWCSRTQRIVIDYPADKLVLTAIRHNLTGAYMPYPQMATMAFQAGIPVASAIDNLWVGDPDSFLSDTAALENAEGYIVRFLDGTMVKAKGEWYCRIHGTHDRFRWEKDVWDLVLADMLDDAKPFLNPDLLDASERFAQALFGGITATAHRLAETVEIGRRSTDGDRKRFAVEFVQQQPPGERGLLFQIWQGANPVEVVKAALRKQVSSQTRINETRYLAGGVRWDQYYKPLESDD